jgi:hypothetical protein
MVSQETIKEFQQAIKAEFDVVLNDKDATEILLGWVGYFDTLAKVDNRKEVQTS